MAYWYIAREDELLLDLDTYMRPTAKGAPWGEMFFRRRLRDAIANGKLEVTGVWLTRSYTESHYQVVIKLYRTMSQMARLVWQLHLGSDLYRGRADMMRAVRGYPSASLLILPSEIIDFYRKPDEVCICQEKHTTIEQVRLDENGAGCPVWHKHRGMSPWELFGKNENLSERMVALPLGNVPLRFIMERHVEEDANANDGT